MNYNKVTVVCDGGRKNGMTYGSFKVMLKEETLYHHQLFFGYGTSNMSEYLAFINAIKFCVAEGLRRVHFQSDSLLMINQVLGNWKTKDRNLKKLRHIARKELLKLQEWSLEKIPNKEVKKILGH